MMTVNTDFQWICQPQAERLILDVVERVAATNQFVDTLQKELLQLTSTRLFDWIEYVSISSSDDIGKDLAQTGFILQSEGQGGSVYFHPGAQLPRIFVSNLGLVDCGLSVVVDSIDNFFLAHGGGDYTIEGSYFGAFRRALVSLENRVACWVIERRGTLSIQPSQESPEEVYAYEQALEKWLIRSRGGDDEERTFAQTLELAQELVSEVGQHRAAWTVLEGERRYWQMRNSAGQLQKGRQDRLGMGWANHDHHTFRSSRTHFKRLVQLFELLGFHCRERFYAGEEAGWGAQVMENPQCRLVLFLDVDLMPGEIANDFAHEPMFATARLGTIGLWCALHGDSILRAGMHHLEAQFMFEELRDDLAGKGVKMMAPFSSFPYLKQAFTVGENWPVSRHRIDRLLLEGRISSEEAEHFSRNGAIGSHLENLQRREGYKGFNQKNVSIIIKKTDPRLNASAQGAY